MESFDAASKDDVGGKIWERRVVEFRLLLPDLELIQGARD